MLRRHLERGDHQTTLQTRPSAPTHDAATPQIQDYRYDSQPSCNRDKGQNRSFSVPDTVLRGRATGITNARFGGYLGSDPARLDPVLGGVLPEVRVTTTKLPR